MHKGTELYLGVLRQTGSKHKASVALSEAMIRREIPVFDIGVITDEIAAELRKPKLRVVK